MPSSWTDSTSASSTPGINVDPMAWTDSTARADDHFPVCFVQTLEQQEFDRCRRVAALAEQARRNHAGVVEDQAVTGIQEFRQIGKHLVRCLSGAAIEQQQTRLVALFEGVLCNQFFRQEIVKIACLIMVEYYIEN